MEKTSTDHSPNLTPRPVQKRKGPLQTLGIFATQYLIRNSLDFPVHGLKSFLDYRAVTYKNLPYIDALRRMPFSKLVTRTRLSFMPLGFVRGMGFFAGLEHRSVVVGAAVASVCSLPFNLQAMLKINGIKSSKVSLLRCGLKYGAFSFIERLIFFQIQHTSEKLIIRGILASTKRSVLTPKEKFAAKGLSLFIGISPLMGWLVHRPRFVVESKPFKEHLSDFRKIRFTRGTMLRATMRNLGLSVIPTLTILFSLVLAPKLLKAFDQFTKKI